MIADTSLEIEENRRQNIKYVKASRRNFRTIIAGKTTDVYFLRNDHGLEMAVTDFGARVIELWVPDRAGVFADIVLGHDNIEKYVNYNGERFLGATIGRFANRINLGRFELSGKSYQLSINEDANTLHGGKKGFDMVVWDADQTAENKIIFKYVSADNEEGFPGNVEVTLTYQLNDNNEFVITYHATTDKPTIINLTHHSFFNFHGEGIGTINDHILTINADEYTPINAALIPTGDFSSVLGTPMDFRQPVEIGSRVNKHFGQLNYAKGYDHNWIINRDGSKSIQFAASVYDPSSGRAMEVHTTEPGIQFYGGNFFDGSTVGKGGKPYVYRSCFALESQKFPDGPNHRAFPSCVLNAGEEYRHVCIYKFSTK